MDAAAELKGVTEIKNVLRGYLIESGGAPRPKELAFPWYSQVQHLHCAPELAQLDASQDAFTRELEYEDAVMLHSGYAPREFVPTLSGSTQR